MVEASRSVADGKAEFSEVIVRARTQGPQTITRNGRVAAVIVAADEWERKAKRAGNLAEFFAACPLRGTWLRVTRNAMDFASVLTAIVNPWTGSAR